MITVGARHSPLSQAQLQEVLRELQQFHHKIRFDPLLIPSQGDKDQRTSLRSLGKTDFFTREIDELLLSGKCQIAIHSAKDLPDPLPQGLSLIALTHGMDEADVLVLREGEKLETLPWQASIGTSSEQREAAVCQLRADLQFVDIRGTIGQRLSKLYAGEVHGVVIAEAAMIRLGLTTHNRLRLPGPTTHFQGQLAILAREDDSEMRALFSCLDARNSLVKPPTVLYLGLSLPHCLPINSKLIHYPVIRIASRDPHLAEIKDAYSELFKYSHLIFTSKTAVVLFFRYLSYFGFQISDLVKKEVIVVGKATAEEVRGHGLKVDQIAKDETAEGVIEVLHSLKNFEKDSHPYFFWPHSALARPLISEFFKNQPWNFRECILYDTLLNQPGVPPVLSEIDEIIFTSASTVENFVKIYGKIPFDKKITAIGPLTDKKLQNFSAV